MAKGIGRGPAKSCGEELQAAPGINSHGAIFIMYLLGFFYGLGSTLVKITGQQSLAGLGAETHPT